MSYHQWCGRCSGVHADVQANCFYQLVTTRFFILKAIHRSKLPNAGSAAEKCVLSSRLQTNKTMEMSVWDFWTMGRAIQMPFQWRSFGGYHSGWILLNSRVFSEYFLVNTIQCEPFTLFTEHSVEPKRANRRIQGWSISAHHLQRQLEAAIRR